MSTQVGLLIALTLIAWAQENRPTDPLAPVDQWIASRFSQSTAEQRRQWILRIRAALAPLTEDPKTRATALKNVDWWTDTKKVAFYDKFNESGQSNPVFSRHAFPRELYEEEYEIAVQIIESEAAEALAYAPPSLELEQAIASQYDEIAAFAAGAAMSKVVGPGAEDYVRWGAQDIIEGFKSGFGNPFRTPHRLLTEEEVRKIQSQIRSDVASADVVNLDEVIDENERREEYERRNKGDTSSVVPSGIVGHRLLRALYELPELQRPRTFALRKMLDQVGEKAKAMSVEASKAAYGAMYKPDPSLPVHSNEPAPVYAPLSESGGSASAKPSREETLQAGTTEPWHDSLLAALVAGAVLISITTLVLTLRRRARIR
jgi:hypothetical protein